MFARAANSTSTGNARHVVVWSAQKYESPQNSVRNKNGRQSKMDRWITLKEFVKREMSRTDSWMVSGNLIIEKMYEIEKEDRAERRAIYFEEPFDGET